MARIKSRCCVVAVGTGRRVVGGLALLVGAGLWLSSTPAHAQGMRNVPLGGRTATMGGAGTAAGNDSAMPYVNPAGMAGIPADVFAVSANLYGYSRRQVPKLSYPNGHLEALGRYRVTEEKLEASGVTDMPSSIMYFQHVGEPGDDMHHVFGMSLIIPNAVATEMVGSTTLTFDNLNAKATENVSVMRRMTDYYVGPTYGVSFSDRLRLGISVFALHTRLLSSIQLSSDNSFGGGAVSSRISAAGSVDGKAWGVVPVVGLQGALTEELWVGAAVAAPSYHLQGSYFVTADTSAVSADPNNLAALLPASSQKTATGSYQSARPLRVNVGGAYEDREAFSFAVDGWAFFERDNAQEIKVEERYTEASAGETTRTYRRNRTSTRDMIRAYGVSAGAEFSLSDILSLRVGGFGDMTNHPAFKDSDDGPYEIREDRAGGTFGLGFLLGSFDTTVGLVYTHGWGKMKVFDSHSEAAHAANARGETYLPSVDTTFDSMLLVLSGAVTTEEAQEQIRQYAPVPPAIEYPTSPVVAPPVPPVVAPPVPPVEPVMAPPPPIPAPVPPPSEPPPPEPSPEPVPGGEP